MAHQTGTFTQAPCCGKINTFKWQLQVPVKICTYVTYYFSVIMVIKISQQEKFTKRIELPPPQLSGRSLPSVKCHSQWSACIRNWSVNSKEAQNICCTLASSSLSQYHLKMNKTSSSSSAGVSRLNNTNDAYDRTQGEGIALCSALTLTFILVAVGNLRLIVMWLLNRALWIPKCKTHHSNTN